MNITQVKITVDFCICGVRIKKGDIIFIFPKQDRALLCYVENGEIGTIILNSQKSDFLKIQKNGDEQRKEII